MKMSFGARGGQQIYVRFERFTLGLGLAPNLQNQRMIWRYIYENEFGFSFLFPWTLLVWAWPPIYKINIAFRTYIAEICLAKHPWDLGLDPNLQNQRMISEVYI